MFKNISIILAVVLVMALGVPVVGWFTQAHQMRKTIENAIAEINKESPFITYTALETSGFPWNVNISLINPRFTGNVGDFLRALTETTNAEGKVSSPFDTMKEWNEDRQLLGSITISINAMSDKYGMRVSGTWKGTSTLKDSTIATVSTSTGDATCSLQLAHGSGLSGNFWDFHVLEKKGAELFNELRLLDCTIPASSYLNEENNELLASSGDSRFYIAHDLDDAQRTLRLYVKYDNAFFTQKGDELISLYMLAIDSARPVFANYSAYGKQSGEVDISFAGPIEFKGGSNDAMNISINKFDVVNALSTQRATFQYVNVPNEDKRDTKLNLYMEFTPGPYYDELLKVNARKLIHEIYVSQDPRLEKLKAIMSKYEEDGAYQVILPAVPRLQPLGKIVQKIDASFQGSATFSNGAFNLAAFELSATPYGIIGTGSGSMEVGKLMPQMNLNFSCRNCIAMIDDATSYIARVKKAIATFDLSAAEPITFDPKRIEGFKAFLTALANRSGNDYSFAIVGDGGVSLTVNGKPINEVQALYNQHLPPPAPAR